MTYNFHSFHRLQKVPNIDFDNSHKKKINTRYLQLGANNFNIIKWKLDVEYHSSEKVIKGEKPIAELYVNIIINDTFLIYVNPIK